MKLPRGGVTELGYDAKNRQTSRKDPLLKTPGGLAHASRQYARATVW